MRPRIAFDAQMLAVSQHLLVLGMESRAAAGATQDIRDAFVVFDQKRTGRRTHEHLDARGARQPFERCHLAGILARSADPECEIAMHAVMAAPHLVGERVGRGGLRFGVGHLEDGRDAPHDGGARTGFQIFLVVEPRLAEMNLRVDDTGQDVQAPTIDDAGRIVMREVADGGDPAAAHAHIAVRPAVMIHDGAALEDEVEGLGHGDLSLEAEAIRAYVTLLTQRLNRSRTCLQRIWSIGAS